MRCDQENQDGDGVYNYKQVALNGLLTNSAIEFETLSIIYKLQRDYCILSLNSFDSLMQIETETKRSFVRCVCSVFAYIGCKICDMQSI